MDVPNAQTDCLCESSSIRHDGGIQSASSSDMQSFIVVLSGILLLGSTGAFFMYVSALSIMAVAVILMALTLMFLLGIRAARQPIPALTLESTVGREEAGLRPQLGPTTDL